MRTFLYRLAAQGEVETSAIVATEVFYGARKPESERQALSLLGVFPVHPFTVSIAARQCAVLPELVRSNRVPDLRDLLIAVTALELEIPIATLNRAHYEDIPGLEIVDLSDLEAAEVEL